VTENYERSVIPRALVAAIPYVGGTIDILLSGYPARRWQERVINLLDELKNKFEHINENQINKEYIQSDEFESLVIQIIQALQTTYEQEKISYFANILTNVAITPSLQNENAQRYVKIINELSGLHIRILKIVKETQDQVRASDISTKIGGNFAEIEAYLSDLAAHSLIYDPSAGTLGWGPGSYRIHPSAIPFIELLTTSTS
jgi:CRISPR/Cas system CSM-associated protein Csm5 (group 7 of RAMP superfamily)